MTPEPSSHTVLIIDDDKGFARLMQKVLHRAGFQSATVNNGADALSWLRTHQADVMLLDLKLPDQMGGDLLTALNEQLGSIPSPFIVVTGHGSEQTAVDMMQRGAHSYLLKGGTFLDTLPVAVKQAIEQVAQEKKLAEAEHALRDSEERYRTLAENSPVGISQILVDGGRVVYLNPTMRSLIEIETHEETTGLTYPAFLTSKSIEQFER